MSGEEFVLAIIAMVAGSAVVITGISKITDLIKTWINRGSENHYSDEDFNRLAKAFMQHKRNMEKRIQNIETVIAADDDGQFDTDTELEITEPEDEHKLNNDLRAKRRVR